MRGSVMVKIEKAPARERMRAYLRSREGKRLRFQILAGILGVLLVVALALYTYSAIIPPAPGLPISAGTHFLLAGSDVNRVYRFSVSEAAATLVGGWRADHGGGVWVYPTNAAPSSVVPPLSTAPCNGSAQATLAKGDYTLVFLGVPPDNITVMSTFTLQYPATSDFPVRYGFFACD